MCWVLSRSLGNKPRGFGSMNFPSLLLWTEVTDTVNPSKPPAGHHLPPPTLAKPRFLEGLHHLVVEIIFAVQVPHFRNFVWLAGLRPERLTPATPACAHFPFLERNLSQSG